MSRMHKVRFQTLGNQGVKKAMANRIGYIGVDVLNNATVCNEATGLLGAGVPLEVVSVYPYKSATFYRDVTLESLRAAVSSLFPMRAMSVIVAAGAAPFVFGTRFVTMLTKAAFGPAEGWKQRLTILYQVIPALVLAMRWRNRGISHIHAHWAHTATSIAMHVSELLGVGFSFTGHANDLFVHRIGLTAKVRRARFVVCISEYHRQFFMTLGGDPERLPVVYCGIDSDRLASDQAGSKPPRPRIVSVGRLVEKKGFDDLISACALLRDDGLDFECVIGGSGPLLGELNQSITANHLEDRVFLTGTAVLQEKLPEFLGSATVFALPCVRDKDGDMDGLPQVLIEAMLCGLPVVSTRLVGIPDLVRDGETGLLVAPRDVRGMASAIQQLISSPTLATDLGDRGQAWAREFFSLRETVIRLSDLFNWAAANPGSSPPERLWPAAPGAAFAYFEPCLLESGR